MSSRILKIAFKVFIFLITLLSFAFCLAYVYNWYTTPQLINEGGSSLAIFLDYAKWMQLILVADTLNQENVKLVISMAPHPILRWQPPWCFICGTCHTLVVVSVEVQAQIFEQSKVMAALFKECEKNPHLVLYVKEELDQLASILVSSSTRTAQFVSTAEELNKVLRPGPGMRINFEHANQLMLEIVKTSNLIKEDFRLISKLTIKMADTLLTKK
jgi:hypothetical protein